MKTTQIYVVRTEADPEGRESVTLGYATGNPDDIKTFYDDKKFYKIELHKVNVVHVEPETAAEKRALKQEQKDLEQRLAEVRMVLAE